MYELESLFLSSLLIYLLFTDQKKKKKNTTPHSALGCTLFKALYGRDPPLAVSKHGATTVSSVEQQLLERDAVLDDLRMHLLRAQ